MDIKKVDMKRSNDDMPCCGMYDSEYPIGFLLNPKQVADLGIPENVEPETTMEIVATIKVKSVTRREGQTELYACITEMGIVTAAKPSPTAKMADAYAQGEDENG